MSSNDHQQIIELLISRGNLLSALLLKASRATDTRTIDAGVRACHQLADQWGAHREEFGEVADYQRRRLLSLANALAERCI